MYILGIDPTRVTEDAEFVLGAVGFNDDGKGWKYVQAAGGIAINRVSRIDEDGQAAELSTSNDDPGIPLGVAQTAFADNEYGWLQIFGNARVFVNGAVAAGEKPVATAEAGSITDGTAEPILQGIYFPDAIADNGTGDVVLTWAHVGAEE